eukprot:SAG31_NODE_2396_length_5784_cov_15.942656_3_plen_216_part_00
MHPHGWLAGWLAALHSSCAAQLLLTVCFRSQFHAGPKKPLTPYIIFMMESREPIKASNPGASNTQIISLIGQTWRNLSDGDKQGYNDGAVADRLRYEREFAKWSSKHPDEVLAMEKQKKDRRAAKARRKRKLKRKEEGAPKHPKSAFLFFTAVVRAHVTANNPGAKITEIAKILGEMWRSLSDKDRLQYQQQAEADKQRYQAEKEAFDARIGGEW